MKSGQRAAKAAKYTPRAKTTPRPAAKATPRSAAKTTPRPAAKATPRPAAKATPRPAAKAAAKTPRKLLYLDNNGTTLICDDAARMYSSWLKCYNPASGSAASQGGREMIDRAKAYVQKTFNGEKYEVVFTSGASESNCFILRSTVDSYRRLRKVKPHLIISAIEHHSTITCCESLVSSGAAELTKIAPNVYGVISEKAVEKAIKPNTCLISIMYANNEIGSISNIPAIVEVAHRRRIPVHSDCVQMFGRYKISLEKTGVDAISASFHKLYGPKGIGLLVIKKELIDGYRLVGQINGSQQGGLRGGTENAPAVASAMSAMKWNFRARTTKNKKLEGLCARTLATLSKKMPMCRYDEYMKKEVKAPLELVVIGPKRGIGFNLPNTLLIAFATEEFCNVQMKKDLDAMGIIVGISSACLASSPNASHVLTAIRAPKAIKQGVIRISFSDYNTLADVAKLCTAFIQLLTKRKLL